SQHRHTPHGICTLLTASTHSSRHLHTPHSIDTLLLQHQNLTEEPWQLKPPLSSCWYSSVWDSYQRRYLWTAVPASLTGPSPAAELHPTSFWKQEKAVTSARLSSSQSLEGGYASPTQVRAAGCKVSFLIWKRKKQIKNEEQTAANCGNS
ncbi:hypothetical protein LDENG_00141860, partial [Lucifuga dentata]